jgi:TadE-like protein
MRARRFEPPTASRTMKRAPRTGSLLVELLLVLPILLVFLLGMIEFSLLLLARQQLETASREAARVAALGGDDAEVEHMARRVLGAGRLGGAEVRAILFDAAGQPLPSGEPIEVDVILPANAAVPDLLACIGFSIRDEQIIAHTVLRKQ